MSNSSSDESSDSEDSEDSDSDLDSIQLDAESEHPDAVADQSRGPSGNRLLFKMQGIS
jgi:hypothetical protein